MSNPFRMYDTKEPITEPAVRFERLTLDDTIADPRDYLFQDPEYRAADQARLDAWHADEWRFIGIVARAIIRIPMGGNSCTDVTLESPGLWGIESDSDASYLDEVFAEECAQLWGMIEQVGKLRRP